MVTMCTISIIDNKNYIYEIYIYFLNILLFYILYETEYSGRSSGRMSSGPGNTRYKVFWVLRDNLFALNHLDSNSSFGIH